MTRVARVARVPMTRSRRLSSLYVALASGVCWFASGRAWALQPGHSGEVESGAHGTPGAHAIHHDGITLFNWPSAEDPRIGLGYLLINFVVLAFLIHRLILRKLVDDNAVRHAEIKRQVEDAATSLAEARSMLADYKTRMDRVDQESQQILEQARRAADADRVRLIGEAETEVERYKATAMAAAQREVGLRRAELEGEVIDRAIARAAEIVSARFTDADHVRLVDDYAVELATNHINNARTGTA